jgi:hypothetical protein
MLIYHCRNGANPEKRPSRMDAFADMINTSESPKDNAGAAKGQVATPPS